MARRTRTALARAGAALVPVVYTELTWTAARGRLREGLENRGYDRTPRDQARRLAAGVHRGRRQAPGARDLRGVLVHVASRYSSPTYRFDYAGLRRPMARRRRGTRRKRRSAR